MDKATAQSALKKLNAERMGLTPSSLVELFEIDISALGADKYLNLLDEEKIFRFHNNVKLLNSSIFWPSDNGFEYVPAPIRAEGFEINAKGTLPTPRLSLSTNADGSYYLALLKDKLNQLGDLAGAKVTRIRVFAKYLPRNNFPNDQTPAGFDPNPNAEFPRDIYYIDRKTTENKFILEYELASILDVEGVLLPNRLVIANRCSWQYRGEGCCYEYANRVSPVHAGVTLPEEAPPVATDTGEKIVDILGMAVGTNRGELNRTAVYNKGDFVFIQKNNIKFYFVAKTSNSNVAPPDTNHWIPDQCSKLVNNGCLLRWGSKGAVKPKSGSNTKGNLPFGGFPAANKVS